MFLEKDWYTNIPNWCKIVPFVLIGISINSIAVNLLLFVLEGLKYWFDIMLKNVPTPLVVSNVMYMWALMISVCVGMNQGWIFGVADIEDISNRFQMMQAMGVLESYIFLPVAIYLGAI